MPTDEQYREAALDVASPMHVSSPAKVDRDVGGAWVRVWLWVDDKDIKDGNENGQFGVGA